MRKYLCTTVLYSPNLWGVVLRHGVLLFLFFTCSSVHAADASFAALMTKGEDAFRRGAFAEAVSYWQEATQRAEQTADAHSRVTVSLYLAQAHLALGQHESALQHLETAHALAKSTGDTRQTVMVLSGLGTASLAAGAVEKAEHSLQEGLQLGKTLGDDGIVAGILNTRGNVYVAQKRYPDALVAYTESARLATATKNAELSVTALSNAAKVALLSGQEAECETLLQQAQDQARSLTPSHDAAYGLLSIGLTYHKLRARKPNTAAALLSRTHGAFLAAVTMAEQLNDLRTISYAAGYLGELYQEQGRVDEALQLTRRAVATAQHVPAPELVYRWYWQTGQLLTAANQPEAALASYRRAVETVQTIRQEVLLRARGVGTSFRETVEPVYFALVDLLLRRAATTTDPTQRTADLKEARRTVEALKVAELRDYFLDDCVDTARTTTRNLDELTSDGTAVVYLITLTDRTELLVSMSTELKSIRVSVSREVLTRQVNEFRRLLVKRTTREYRPAAQQLYRWLIRPLEADLTRERIHTLVFVPDGPLRTIPLAALHDGTSFLVHKYAVAVTPSLELTDPRPLQRQSVRVLAAGVSEAVQGFPALPQVPSELQAVQGRYGGHILLDREFVVPSIEEQLQGQPFTILHLASHGQFTRDAKDTFVLTFNDRLTLDRLAQLLAPYRFRHTPIEMLTLSACETALGDERAALGLAGVAVKAGVRSALATLWLVNDEAATLLMTELYHQLEDPAVSRAVALQRAQIKLLQDQRYQHPGYWSPFLLINNWM